MEWNTHSSLFLSNPKFLFPQNWEELERMDLDLMIFSPNTPKCPYRFDLLFSHFQWYFYNIIFLNDHAWTFNNVNFLLKCYFVGNEFQIFIYWEYILVYIAYILCLLIIKHILYHLLSCSGFFLYYQGSKNRNRLIWYFYNIIVTP